MSSSHLSTMVFKLLALLFISATLWILVYSTPVATRINQPTKSPNNKKIIINVADAPVGRPNVSAEEVAQLPTSFDARERWPMCRSIRRVSYQGSCGSCWAVITTDVAADRFCIATNGKIQIRLSPWHLLQCCGLGECADGIEDFGGCRGGDPWGTWRFMAEQGIVTEECKPYPEWIRWFGQNDFDEDEVQCEVGCDNASMNYQAARYYAKSYYRLPNHEGTIRKEIYEHGPVVAHLNINKPELNTRLHDGMAIYRCTSQDLPTHGIRLIGWGVDEDGGPYWLAVNSWDRHWGVNGTFKIARGENSCRIEEFVSGMVPRI